MSNGSDWLGSPGRPGLRTGIRIAAVRRLLLLSALSFALACGSTVQIPDASQRGLAQGSPEQSSEQLQPDMDTASPSATARPSATAGQGTAASPRATRNTEVEASTSTPAPREPSEPTAAASGSPEPGLDGPSSAGVSSGRGYDDRTIYIGVPTIKDFDQFAASAGVNTLDTGDQEANVRAMVAYINENGGVLGRELVAVFHDTKTAEFFSNPAVAMQAICEDFTQDRPVAAVIDLTFSDGPQMWDCWKNVGIPFFSGLYNLTDQVELDQYHPYRYAMGNNRANSYLPALLDRQSELGYFTPWDTVNGRAGRVPVKVGLMYAADVPADKRVFDQLAVLLRGRGIDVAEPVGITGADSSQIAGAVIKFKSEGVTHIYMTYFGQAITFMNTAESQRYRPRYAAWAHLSPGALEQAAPALQLRGALGAGFRPHLDVSPRQNPGDHNSAGPFCRGIFNDAGLHYEQHSVAESFAFIHCDSFRLFAGAVTEAGSPAAEPVREGFSVIGTTFESASVLRNAFSGTRSDASGGIRDLGYVEACSCFRYLSNEVHPS